MHHTIEEYMNAKPAQYNATRKAMYDALQAGEWSSNAEGEMTLFRGTCDEEGMDCDPMSWTTDIRVAQWFANRNSRRDGQSTPLLLTATFPASSILFVIGGHEAEVLVDTSSLETMAIIEEATWDAEEVEIATTDWNTWMGE